tara:strand:- start:1141 stop:2448 length:1308 start_codon:yes stop_codon:yes gene_type:complete
MKSNIKFQKILNDLKKRPIDASKDLKISEKKIKDFLKGKLEIPDKIIHKALKIWPVNYSDFYSITDDIKKNFLIMRSKDSDLTERIMNRGGKPYYAYKDTVVSKLSPFKPELIEELVKVKDNSPNNNQVKFNNGHFLHQFTYFIGPVNFYYEIKGKKKVAKMNTGDSMYISPYVRHSFTTRKNKKNINGKILALTFCDVLNNDIIDQICILGYNKVKDYKININDEKNSFWKNLDFHLNIASINYKKIKEFTKIDLKKIKKNKRKLNLQQTKKISECLNVNIKNLIPPNKSQEVIIIKHSDSRIWHFPNEVKKIYRFKELANINMLPMVRSYEVDIISEANHNFFLKVPSHQYIYNIGNKKISINVENKNKDYLDPGDSMYLKPNTKHKFINKGKLLISRVNGSFSSDVIYQISSFSNYNLKKTINDNRPWFNKN